MIPDHQLTGPPDAPIVVLSNSLGTDRRMWDAQLPVLAERFRVLTYDQRGHGDTPTGPGPYTLGELAGDVLELLDHLQLNRVHFAGVSLGGMIGMWLGEHAPDRIDRLALICTSAELAPESWLERGALVRASGTEALADSTLGRWFTPAFAERADIATKYLGMLRSCSDSGYADCCAAIASMDLVSGLSGITAETLVIAGREDPATPPEHGERIASTLGGRLEVLPRAAHLANVEQAEQVNTLLSEHFQDALGAP